MTEVVFSKQDAVELLAIAQEAPIPGGARQAVARQALYERFVNFYETVTAVPEPQPATPTPRKRRTNAEIAADTASQAPAAADVLA